MVLRDPDFVYLLKKTLDMKLDNTSFVDWTF